MPTVILVRHGRSTANATGVLAGRLPGVHLDDAGVKQAVAVGERLAGVRLAAAVTSPLERCRETRREITTPAGRPLRAAQRQAAVECDYGEWQGRALKDLAKEKLWKTVQAQPSAATFPGGESMRAMQDRAVAAVRRHDARVAAEHGDDAVWLAVSHGDVIKSILADALGTHLDLFQRIHVDPASVSIVRYTESRPFVIGTNTHAGDLAWLTPPKKPRAHRQQRGARTPRWVEAPDPRQARPRVSDMPVVHRFDPPERFVAGTVGEPGQRTFFLQAREGARLVSVSLEKQQVQALAERIDELLDELMRAAGDDVLIPAIAPRDLTDNQPLEQPIEEEFRAGTMTLSWDGADERIVIEVFPFTEAAVVSPEQLAGGPRGPPRARARRDLPRPAHGRRRAVVRGARRAP